MSALGKVVRAGVGRRRVQTLIIVLATLMAVTASILGGSLLVASNAPFDDAFARQDGAHLAAQFDANAVTADRVAASGEASGVSASSGPFPTVSLAPTVDVPSASATSSGSPGAATQGQIPPMTIVGRDDPSAAVDDIALTEGKWPTDESEIVVAAERPEPLGTTFTFPDVPGNPTLTVVGKARSATRTADAWVASSVIDTLAAGGNVEYQILYRLTDAETAADVAAGLDAVTSAVGADALTGSQSWLAVRDDVTRETALFVPFLVAFGALGLVMSVLVVGTVIAGAVGAGTRRIGILKAFGFTPAQVVRGYLGQAMIPAAVGCVLGVVAGNLLAIPVLSQTETAYSTTGLTVSVWVNLVAVGGILAVVAVTALAAAWRAGRLRTVEAIAVGRTPSARRGLLAARLATRLPVPRAIGLGVARPFARPARAGAMVASVLFGVAAITFTVGLSSSLAEVLAATGNEGADVLVRPSGPQGEYDAGGRPPEVAEPTANAADPADVTAVLDAQPGTADYYTMARTQVTVSGMSGEVSVEAFTGDASWGGYEMIAGRWFERAGEVVVPTPFLSATGSEVGDRITLHHQGVAISVRIVGEVFDTTDGGKEVFTDAATFADADPALATTSYHIAAEDGVEVGAYVTALNTDLEPLGVVAQVGGDDQNSTITDTLNALSALLSIMLVTVAALGVLNSVVLDTRERVHEIGIHKALGMVPRQTTSMVITSVVVPGLVGAALGVPLGLAVHAMVVPAMGDSAGLTLPAVVTDVYGAVMVTALGVSGVLIAVIGSLLPAGWAARTRTATALRTE
jgi:putative ABC transport system permease protein